MENGVLAVLTATSAAGMGFAHYGAPRLARRMLHPLECYVVGVSLGILAPLAAWTWLAKRDWKPWGAAAALAVGAGAGTAAAYMLDRWGAGNGEPGKPKAVSHPQR